MEDVERKILIPENFWELPDDQKELISNEMFQYIWGWKNKKHDKPISVNGVVYWIIQSPPPNKNIFHFCNEEQVAVWKYDLVYRQTPFARPIGGVDFYRHRKPKKVDFQRIAGEICREWRESRVADANQRVEDWKVRRRELFIEHYGVDTPYHDPYVKDAA